MDIAQIRTEIAKSMIRIPNFIDTTSTIDFTIWNNMRFINDVLIQLVSNRILNETIISKIIEQFEDELDMISDVSEDFDIILNYYYRLLEYMLTRCIEEERFEAASNIRNFADLNAMPIQI
jgi:hypothetical protein